MRVAGVVKIEIWSDVVCPWCYIGKRRIENALAGFAHADEVEVHWRSYQLDPGAPTEPTESTSVMLAKKYGQSPEGAKQMQDRVEAVAAEEGLVYRLSETLHLNTVDSHRLIHLAHQQGGNALQGRSRRRCCRPTSPRHATSPTTPCCVRSPSPRGSTPPASTRCSPPASSRPTCTPTSRRRRPTARPGCRSS